MVIGILATIESVLMVYWIDKEKTRDVPKSLRMFHAFGRQIIMYICWCIPNEEEEIERENMEEEKQAILEQLKASNMQLGVPNQSKNGSILGSNSILGSSTAMQSLANSMNRAKNMDNRDDKALSNDERNARRKRRNSNWYDCVSTVDRFAFLVALGITIGFGAAYL